MKKLILVELNELNLEYVERYAKQGLLPTFQRLIGEFGYERTQSETEYDRIEPWIQWVTVHTGKRFDEHRVFRLGDGPSHAGEQIWEHLEQRGLSVAAFCPMNAANRMRRPAFFVPDPWANAQVSGSVALKALYSAVAQAVNDNAEAKITLASAAKLFLGLTLYSQKRRFADYALTCVQALRFHWARAALLEQLLGDCFIKLWNRSKPDFASVFLNGAAHIQHHFLFNSSEYSGEHRNPPWYVKKTHDPILEIYRRYDRFLADLLRLSPQPRLIIATGLHQDPVERPVYYYRLRDHSAFLRKIGVAFSRVEPRMSRDFLVAFADSASAQAGAQILLSGRGPGGKALFEVDNRGSDLFVTLVHSDVIDPGMLVLFGTTEITDFSRDVVFVALKNAQHNGIGYLIDTGAAKVSPSAQPAALEQVWNRVVAAF